MNIITSFAGIIDMERPRQGTADIIKAGFQDILLDMSFGCSPGEMEAIEKIKKISPEKVFVLEHPEELAYRFKSMVDFINKEQLRTTVGIAPYLLCNTKHSEYKEKLIRVIEESIKLCGKQGGQYIVIQPWAANQASQNGEEVWRNNREYYFHFAKLAREQNVMILLQNLCRDVRGHLVRGICADEEEAVLWVDRLNAEIGEERFGFCMDVGICNLCGQNMYDYVSKLNNRLKAVIIRDCDGNAEASLLPFTSVRQGQPQTDWLNLIRGLRKIEFDGQLIFNCHETAGAFSPVLKPAYLQLAKSIADFFVWQIGIEKLIKNCPSVVLFGAGNMCRNYMKCYGEQCPPLFTCDNNQALWGTTFCGLEVKNPESLKTLPKDCVILVCNIYYREIERQLREMNIHNSIVFFNDEYMPSFYFDRLNRGGE